MEKYEKFRAINGAGTFHSAIDMNKINEALGIYIVKIKSSREEVIQKIIKE